MVDFIQKKGGAICFMLCMLIFMFITNTFYAKGVYVDSPHFVVSFYVLYLVLGVLSFFAFFLLVGQSVKVDFIAFLLFLRLFAHFLPIPTIGIPPHFAVNYLTSLICLIVYLVMYNFTRDKEFVKKTLIVFFVVFACQIIVEFLLSPVSLFVFRMDFKSEIATAMGSSNALAAKLVPFFAFAFCNSAKKWRLFLTLLALFAVLVTRSRTGCANFILVAFLIYVWDGRISLKLIYRFWGVGFLFISVIYYFLFYQGLFDKFFFMETSSSDTRFFYWGNAIDIIASHPITGVGFYYDFLAENPHNVILDLLMRSGLIGATIAMGMVLFIFKTIKNKLNDDFIRGCFVGVLAFVIHGLFEVVFFSYISDFMIWTLIGAMMGCINNNQFKFAYDRYTCLKL
jgi:O-antigen ligase